MELYKDLWNKFSQFAQSEERIGRVGVADEFGITEQDARNLIFMFKNKDLVRDEKFIPSKIRFDEKKDSLTLEANISSKHTDRVKVLEEFLGLCRVDQKVWEVDRYLLNAWDVTMKGKDKDTAYAHTNYQIKVWLKKRILLFDHEKFITNLTGDIAKRYSGSGTKPRVTVKKRLYDNAQIVSIPDIHLGRQAWHEETGWDYDIDIARENYWKGLSGILQDTDYYKPEKIYFIVGNDLLNYGIPFPYPMTDKGTPQDSDTRWQKLFRIAYNLTADTITELDKHAPVEVIFVPGNHDTIPVFYLGEILKAAFINSKTITINNSPMRRRFFEYGTNMFCASHGNFEKQSAWHAIMSSEREMWGRTKYRYAFLGHIHHQVEVKKKVSEKYSGLVIPREVPNEDYMGVLINYLPALTYQHAYEFERGMIGSIRSAQSFIHDINHGRIATLQYNL